MNIALTILAGSVGAGVRFVVVGAVQRFVDTEWPWGTAVVNAIGALSIGVVVGIDASRTTTVALAGGITGFTTFSAWMVEAAALWIDGRGGHLRAAIDVLVPLAGGLALTALGLALGRVL